MSTAFSRKFENFVESVVDTLNIKGKPGNQSTRTYKSGLSTGTTLPGDVLFFTYRSDKFGTGEHLVMVVGNKRGPNGIFIGRGTGISRGKRYLSAVKLNNMWSFTAGLIIDAYQDRDVKYTRKKNDDKIKKAFISLVGRKNYRTYIIDNVKGNAREVGDKEEVGDKKE